MFNNFPWPLHRASHSHPLSEQSAFSIINAPKTYKPVWTCWSSVNLLWGHDTLTFILKVEDHPSVLKPEQNFPNLQSLAFWFLRNYDVKSDPWDARIFYLLLHSMSHPSLKKERPNRIGEKTFLFLSLYWYLFKRFIKGIWFENWVWKWNDLSMKN